ncbi:FadR/GntR family transcriptional regulator [Clostridium beijerinckii]|uniref:DNA-binding FadR family transcriptional regulator n=1 Tax=Clostridium beijerinckii TaxID=1520 RepID=A0AAX0B0G1_CLOBE|nr:FadR/GntR family transcriptional regulator [Clostridium beijerinckii]MBA8937111.1 DNA-binding FadR family transcriptional regulator [Clostridium beijerinckii]NRT33887.1 DNA-binding FadR family transcriptional regulator [Clostridium beijerinckii]NRT46683.1 DNA-binding FadR family transcriptional regulator [Clostridium beijerinckii]NRT88693.1 DNA-binding FadR family transcriptional regulator [Clostridium beijerinckii]NRU40424.1 DNA-binding FadR family transcriptional regulator [Clostridium be
MPRKEKSLSESVADDILAMITIDKKFNIGDKLPNENELSTELKVSRTTLREAIRILVAHNILEIRRGKGTFVSEIKNITEIMGLENLSTQKLDVKDLYEMRLIFEPETAYYAAKRATDKELERILYYGRLEEEMILNNEDRTEVERSFHKSIAKATHNEFMNKLMPILYKAIDNGVILSDENKSILQNTLNDHRMIMEFLEARDAEGAKTAMKIHIIRAMKDLGIPNE